MKKILLSLLAPGIILPVFAQTSAQTTAKTNTPSTAQINAPPMAAKLDTVVEAYVHASGFNGSVLVATKGTVILEKGYGYRNKATGALNDSNTVFQIGSITKQFTSAIILQLAEQKKLSVQDKLTKYIPDYPNGDQITIKELLTHTSGVHNFTDDPQFVQTESFHPIPRDSMIARFKYKPLDFTPGEKYRYSNSGYFLLGYIIEKVTGRPYFQIVRQRIFRPLHMDHSGFDFANLHSPDKAIGYSSSETTVPAPITDSSVSFSAGAIYTTVGDLYKWDRGLREERIISAASQVEAYTPHLANYGYGWLITTVDGKKMLEHGGGITGFISDIRRVPDDGTCIVVLNNENANVDLAKMTQDIYNVLNGKDVQLPKVKVAVSLDTALLRQYVGQYELGPRFILAITLEDGHLYGTPTGQPKTELFAEKKDLFFPKRIEAELEFVRGDGGDIEKMILHQNGREVPARRLVDTALLQARIRQICEFVSKTVLKSKDKPCLWPLYVNEAGWMAELAGYDSSKKAMAGLPHFHNGDTSRREVIPFKDNSVAYIIDEKNVNTNTDLFMKAKGRMTLTLAPPQGRFFVVEVKPFLVPRAGGFAYIFEFDGDRIVQSYGGEWEN